MKKLLIALLITTSAHAAPSATYRSYLSDLWAMLFYKPVVIKNTTGYPRTPPTFTFYVPRG